MALKARMDELISDVKSSIPMFKLSPAKRITKDGEPKKDEKMKTKILETWNNLRYDFGAGAYLKKDSPIWILGICHTSKGEEDFVMEEMIIEDGDSDNPEIVTQLAKRVFTDFASRPWFTYRKHFPAISGTKITSDTGWGCMLRSAQMMIAQGFFFHYLGRDWRWLQTENRHKNHLHKKILGWFVDDPGEHCPLSIQHLSQIGRKFGVIPGNWYGPNTVAYIVQHAVEASKKKVRELRDVVVYVAQDCTVYSQDVYDLCGWTKDSAFEPDSSSNNTFSDSDYTESVSSECESSVYVDEIADEVSEITRFSVPEDVTLSNKNINENMIAMREFVTSTDINPEVTIGEQWEPKKNSPLLKKKVASKQLTQNYPSKPRTFIRSEKIVVGNEPFADCSNLTTISEQNFDMAQSEPSKTQSGIAKQSNVPQPHLYKVTDEPLLTGESSQAKTPYEHVYREQKSCSDEKHTLDASKSSIRGMFQTLLTKTSDGANVENERKTAKHESQISDSTLTGNERQTSTSLSSMFSSSLDDVLSRLNPLQFESRSEASSNETSKYHSKPESRKEQVCDATNVSTKNSDPERSELTLDSLSESTCQEQKHKLTLRGASSSMLSSEHASSLLTIEPHQDFVAGHDLQQTAENVSASSNFEVKSDSSYLDRNAEQISKSSQSHSKPTYKNEFEDNSLSQTSTKYSFDENIIKGSASENLLANGPENVFDSSNCDNSIKNNLDEIENFNSINEHSRSPERIPEPFVSNCEKEQQKITSAVENDSKRDRAEFLDSNATTSVGLSENDFAHALSDCDSDEGPILPNAGGRLSSPGQKNLTNQDEGAGTLHTRSHPNPEQDSSWGPMTGQHQTDSSRVPGPSPRESPKKFRPAAVIILIPVRLGESNLNPIYTPCIQEMLSLESSIGIIGGKPKHSLYFVGFQGEHLLHLDPHYCQIADTPSGYKKNLHNYHTMSIRKTNIKKIDPSCCFGFYCRNAKQFEQFKQEVQGSFSSNSQSRGYPMCLILEGKSGDHHLTSPLPKTTEERTVVSLPEDDHNMATRFENDISLSKPPTDRSKNLKKSETRGFSVDEMGAKLNKLIPDPSKFYPKFMRQKSSSPVRKKKLTKEESLESQFELL